MTESAIKATKPQPARSMCSYPEAIFRVHFTWENGNDYVSQGIESALAIMCDRSIENVQADLERGHV